MGFCQMNEKGLGGYAKVWKVDKKEKYSVVNVSTRRKVKNKKDGSYTYELDFSEKNVLFLGEAHKKLADEIIPKKGLTIQILSCDVSKKYNAEKNIVYTNFFVYDFKIANRN